jgi:hypothetical protein
VWVLVLSQDGEISVSWYVFFLFNRTTLQVFVTYLTGALYVRNCRWTIVTDRHSWNVSTQKAFSLPFSSILVNCAPSGEMHNYWLMLKCVFKKKYIIYWSLERRINFCEFKSSELTPICNGDGVCSLDGMRWAFNSTGSWESWEESKSLFYLWRAGRRNFCGLKDNSIFFVPVYEKVTFLLDVGRTGFWRLYHSIACWMSVTVCIHLRLGFSSHTSVALVMSVWIHQTAFVTFGAVNMACIQLKNGVLLENASVTTLSLLFLYSGCPMYSRTAYLSCEKYWPTMWRHMQCPANLPTSPTPRVWEQ